MRTLLSPEPSGSNVCAVCTGIAQRTPSDFPIIGVSAAARDEDDCRKPEELLMNARDIDRMED